MVNIADPKLATTPDLVLYWNRKKVQLAMGNKLNPSQRKLYYAVTQELRERDVLPNYNGRVVVK